MKWTREGDSRTESKPIKSWCERVESGAMAQAEDLTRHSRVISHVALMPDCHQGYGMPIGGVIACDEAVIPNAVGVDIGCGVVAVETNVNGNQLKDPKRLKAILDEIKRDVPLGEGHAHKHPQQWGGFNIFKKRIGAEKPAWMDSRCWDLAERNLGSLGGGNHFIEIQASENDVVWLMLHSGSRNLGYRIASVHHKLAVARCQRDRIELPTDQLAFFPTDSDEGRAYLRDMTFALEYAMENRRRMMEVFKRAIARQIKKIEFLREINIHHNYASLESHFGRRVWVHRKGATAADKDQWGVIPGSMGTASYIVRGRGNPESFMSCSHGAGRKMGRNEACRRLSVDECERAMGTVVHDPWRKLKLRGGKKGKDKGALDLSEAPQAYKNINDVIKAQLDLIEPIVKLRPLAVLKG